MLNSLSANAILGHLLQPHAQGQGATIVSEQPYDCNKLVVIDLECTSCMYLSHAWQMLGTTEVPNYVSSTHQSERFLLCSAET